MQTKSHCDWIDQTTLDVFFLLVSHIHTRIHASLCCVSLCVCVCGGHTFSLHRRFHASSARFYCNTLSLWLSQHVLISESLYAVTVGCQKSNRSRSYLCYIAPHRKQTHENPTEKKEKRFNETDRNSSSILEFEYRPTRRNFQRVFQRQATVTYCADSSLWLSLYFSRVLYFCIT